MKMLDIPKSGKCGGIVWQRNRYAQYCYPAFIPFNPRTVAQVAVRQTFHAVSVRWRQLTQVQRDIWNAVARLKKTKPRLNQCGDLTGFNYFVKVNVALVNRGEVQVDLPPGYREAPELVLSCQLSGASPQVPQRAVLVPRGGLSFGRSALLRYRSCTGYSPKSHRRSTQAGRRTFQPPQNRLLFPRRCEPPRCRGAPARI